MNKRPQPCVALGLAVRSLRDDVGISQEELGFRSDLHRTYIGAIERGEHSPSFLTIIKLARALAVEPATLVARAQERLAPQQGAELEEAPPP